MHAAIAVASSGEIAAGGGLWGGMILFPNDGVMAVAKPKQIDAPAYEGAPNGSYGEVTDVVNSQVNSRPAVDQGPGIDPEGQGSVAD